MRVHSALGPGLLESTYEACLDHELRKSGLRVERQVYLPIVYDGLQLHDAYRIDLLVEDAIVVELKAVDTIVDVHKAQVVSYLKLSGRKLGLIINFNVTQLRAGIRRVVMGEDWKGSPSSVDSVSTQ
jgi:GxxExxY protein